MIRHFEGIKDDDCYADSIRFVVASLILHFMKALVDGRKRSDDAKDGFSRSR